MTIRIKYREKPLEELDEAAIREELSRLEATEEELLREAKTYEEKYGIDTHRFAVMYEKAKKERTKLPIPEDADADAIEWYALALKLREIEKRKKLLQELASLA